MQYLCADGIAHRGWAYDVQVPAIAKHVANIPEEAELDQATISKMEMVHKRLGYDCIHAPDGDTLLPKLMGGEVRVELEPDTQGRTYNRANVAE